jgi:hypothetical protein
VKIRELFPSSPRLAIGGAEIKGTNTVEQYQNALLLSGQQSHGKKVDQFLVRNSCFKVRFLLLKYGSYFKVRILKVRSDLKIFKNGGYKV